MRRRSNGSPSGWHQRMGGFIGLWSISHSAKGMMTTFIPKPFDL
ncbi:hypothetical protein Barb4_02539 [Bacteroidales bacterium Barb4]|nr:hypothetical protein Barb4_02539 [Bacteroidales bacterium Barb4]